MQVAMQVLLRIAELGCSQLLSVGAEWSQAFDAVCGIGGIWSAIRLYTNWTRNTICVRIAHAPLSIQLLYGIIQTKMKLDNVRRCASSATCPGCIQGLSSDTGSVLFEFVKRRFCHHIYIYIYIHIYVCTYIVICIFFSLHDSHQPTKGKPPNWA